MDARTQYFHLMQTIIYESNYLYLLSQKHHRRRQGIGALLAILSGGSLAAWLLYSNFAFAYATVIVLTQIASSVMPFFEVVKHDDALKLALTEFQPVKRQAEMGWRRIESENLDDKDIETMIQFLTLEEANVFDKMMSLGISDDERVRKAAADRAEQYMEVTFPTSS
ncbi:MAG: hypothetical protein ACOX6W_01755 [Lentisphaeria bacterium]